MLFKYLQVFSFFIFLSSGLFSQYESAFELDHPGRLKKEQEIFSSYNYLKDSTGTHQALFNLKALASRYNDIQSLLQYELFLLKSDKHLSKESQERNIAKNREIIQQAKMADYTLLQIYALIQMGDMLGYTGLTGASISYYMQVYDLINKVDSNYLPRTVAGLDYYLGYTFYVYEDFNRAKYYIERCLKGSVSNSDIHFIMLMHDLLSQINLKLGDYTKSRYHIEEAKKIYESVDSTSWWRSGWDGIYTGNFAKIHYFKEEYKKAIPGLKSALQITEEKKLFDNVATFGLLLANCYLKTGEYDKAKTLIPQIKNAVYKKGNDTNHKDLYRFLSIVHEDGNSFERKTQILDSFIYWNNRLNSRMDTNFQVQKDLDFEVKVWKKRKSNYRKK